MSPMAPTAKRKNEPVEGGGGGTFVRCFPINISEASRQGGKRRGEKEHSAKEKKEGDALGPNPRLSMVRGARGEGRDRNGRGVVV